MKVKRYAAIELDNGDIQVSIVIPAADRARFFDLAPLPGTELLLAPVAVQAVVATAQNASKPPAQVAGVKPPTQTVSPAGGAPGPVGNSAAKDAQEVMSLCDNPWFQQFAAEQVKPKGEHDSLMVAQLFVKQRCLQGALWDSDASLRFREVVAEYSAWCQKKGYR